MVGSPAVPMKQLVWVHRPSGFFTSQEALHSPERAIFVTESSPEEWGTFALRDDEQEDHSY
jgi:hypothetical protein